MKRAIIFAVVVVGVAFGVALPARAAVNLIVNGDFQSGNTGFSSDYTYEPANGSGTALWNEGTYGIATNPQILHYLWTRSVTIRPGRET